MSARLSRKKHSFKSNKKKPQNKRKASTKFGRIFASIIVVIISVIFVSGTFWFNRLNKQFVGADSATALDSNYHTILYAVIDDLNGTTPSVKNLDFVVVDNSGKKVNFYHIKDDFSIDLGLKYGEVTLDKLYSLGMLQGDQSQKDAINFINSTMFNLFAFKVDRYIYVDSSESSVFDALLKKGNYLPFFTNVLLDHSDTKHVVNMSLDEIYQTAKFISELPDDRLIESDMSKADLNTLDDTLREMTIDSRFALEAKNIAVMNGGEKAGVASFGSRVIKNLGGRVVSVVNTNEKFGESFLVTDNPDDLSTSTLSATFGIKKILTKSQAEALLNSNDLYRADILVVLID